MLTRDTLTEQARAYGEGRITLDEFERWMAERVPETPQDSDAMGLALQIESALVLMSSLGRGEE